MTYSPLSRTGGTSAAGPGARRLLLGGRGRPEQQRRPRGRVGDEAGADAAPSFGLRSVPSRTRDVAGEMRVQYTNAGFRLVSSYFAPSCPASEDLTLGRESGRRTSQMGWRRTGLGIRFVAATVAAMLVVLVGCFGSAYATRTVKLASHISIKSHHNTTFTGRVTSRNTGCEDARKVTLYTTTKLKLGTARTNKHGRWKITASGFAGISLHHFFAKVAKVSSGTAGTIYVCKAATSKTIPF